MPATTMPPAQKAPAAKKQQPKANDAMAAKKHELAISYGKEENFALWFPDVVRKSELIEYYEISGCYILRPYAFFIWESIQEFMNKEIKKKGVQNAYFPLFVTEKALQAEADHVEGFSPEVAWVTRAGSSDLAKPIAIRPTSETIMYPAFAKWIRSHRDLPLLLNQWTSVVRWEFKQPTPFIRSREFLWQEGHTAHATTKEAEEFTLSILDLYERVYGDLLACPVVKGVKSENEKFPGGYMTTTVEIFVPTNGRAIQGATSHNLEHNFAKHKNLAIQYEDEEGKKQYVAQTSWGLTTRSIGAMIMVHGDDDGLCLPPRIAQIQVVIVPISYKDDADAIREKANEIAEALKEKDVRVHVDDRRNYKPGNKFAHWELKGVPVRMEIGPKDLEKGVVQLAYRYQKAAKVPKTEVKISEIAEKMPTILKEVHAGMLAQATKTRNENIVKCMSFDEVMPALNAKKMILAPWCETMESEEEIKAKTKELSEQENTKQKKAQSDAAQAFSPDGVEEEDKEEFAPALTGAMKSLCIPLEQPEMPEGTKCFFTGKPAKRWCLFGRSY